MTMKRVVSVCCFLFVCVFANAQFYYQDSKNSQMLRPLKRQQICRKEIILPQVNGYNVYKADLHTHSVFSDGQVLPKYRINEAWLEGLDVIAVTEHIEYRPSEATFHDYLKKYTDKKLLSGVKAFEDGEQWVDLNYSVKEAQKVASKYGVTVIPGTEITRSGEKVGHFNALFTTDNNLIYDPDPVQSLRNAKAQNALVMHNHPGWRRTSLDYTPTEKAAYDEGLIDGVEVVNGSEVYPLIIDRVQEKGLFIAANSDIHASTAETYGVLGEHRPMTLIFAKDKSLDSLREALESGRTLAYAHNTLFGDESLLIDFFMASIEVIEIGEEIIQLTNKSSVPYVLQKKGNNQRCLDAFSTIRVNIGKGRKTLSFSVLNMWSGSEKHPVMKLSW